MTQIIIKQTVTGVLMSILKDPKKTVEIRKIHFLKYFFKLYKKKRCMPGTTASGN